MDEERTGYHIEQVEDGTWGVVTLDGRTVLGCGRDRANAEQYCVLMNQAFRAGYREGYRAGRGRRRDR